MDSALRAMASYASPHDLRLHSNYDRKRHTDGQRVEHHCERRQPAEGSSCVLQTPYTRITKDKCRQSSRWRPLLIPSPHVPQ